MTGDLVTRLRHRVDLLIDERDEARQTANVLAKRLAAIPVSRVPDVVPVQVPQLQRKLAKSEHRAGDAEAQLIRVGRRFEQAKVDLAAVKRERAELRRALAAEQTRRERAEVETRLRRDEMNRLQRRLDSLGRAIANSPGVIV